MKYNKDIHNKLFFIGFIIGIIPYFILISLANLFNASSFFKTLLFIFATLTSFINGFILKKISLQSK